MDLPNVGTGTSDSDRALEQLECEAGDDDQLDAQSNLADEEVMEEEQLIKVPEPTLPTL